MQIFVRGAADLVALNLEKNSTVRDICEYVAEESGLDVEDFVLSFHGTPLSNEQTVDEFEFVSGSMLDAVVKMCGGKIHGKLNQAGKVKNNTPKVAPQEKPKKKTGRARRREQYAHRFANKIVSVDGRRGPNSNH